MSSFFVEPPHPDPWQMIAKTWIWLLIGIVLGLLVFAMMGVLWAEFFLEGEGMFKAFVFIVLACVVTLIGMAIFSWLLNMMFSQDYYDFWKMFWFSVLANWLLVFLFLPLYFMMAWDLNSLLLMYALHVMFAFFMSFMLLELTSNPNYAASDVIGSSLGFVVTLVIYVSIYIATIGTGVEENTWSNVLYVYVLSPFLIAYVVIPLLHGIWTQIYYGIYSSGNNPLFVPQAQDMEVEEEAEEDEINIDIS